MQSSSSLFVRSTAYTPPFPRQCSQTCLVYRGHWCPFCLHWLTSFTTIAPLIIAAGGEPVIVTAEENPEFLSAVRDKTGFKNTAILDPDNKLAADLKKRGLLDVAITAKANYPNGMAQPAVLVMSKGGRVLYSWAIKPALVSDVICG